MKLKTACTAEPQWNHLDTGMRRSERALLTLIHGTRIKNTKFNSLVNEFDNSSGSAVLLLYC